MRSLSQPDPTPASTAQATTVSPAAFIWTPLPTNLIAKLIASPCPSIADVYIAAFESAREKVIADEAATRYRRRTTLFLN